MEWLPIGMGLFMVCMVGLLCIIIYGDWKTVEMSETVCGHHTIQNDPYYYCEGQAMICDIRGCQNVTDVAPVKRTTVIPIIMTR